MQPASRWKVLVVDHYTSGLLASVAKMFDILQEHVTGVEMIEQDDRQAQPGFEACYILCPTTKNVERIIHDLAPPGNGAQPKYAAAHLFFIDGELTMYRRLMSLGFWP